MAFLELEQIGKRFGAVPVVANMNLKIEKGEFVSFLGGSGCGKTTTLRMIAGFETPSEGRITMDGQDVVSLPARRRNIGMVFQNYALFPNMTVAGNVAFGLKMLHMDRATSATRVAEMLELVHMSEFSGRYPHQLSGGQQQRVALARALAIRPRMLLLDEPLSALDALIRTRLREEIRAIQRSVGITTVYVTHDQEEALSISDRVVVMERGRIEQVGTPKQIYDTPATAHVASFIGTLNLLPATVVAEGTDPALEVGGQIIHVAGPLRAARGSRLHAAIRPERITLEGGSDRNTDGGPQGENRLEGTVREALFLGSTVRLIIDCGAIRVVAERFNNTSLPLPLTGQVVTLSFAPEACVPVYDEPEAAVPVA